MKISEDRLYHLCHKIHDRLYLDEYVDYTDEDESLKVIKKSVMNFFQFEEQLDEGVRQKIRSLKRMVAEGTPEWDVLYRKYYEEELAKHKR